ncbi:DUF1365 domain-containing protein [Gordonia crocea]|uniref:DUF1365 domain-containing protein n=1 Tax=Gordonia crocea TaxID=589162 RepID=A0A7M3SUH5_9ACTN|nr:DUF1365 domain-containing protein [Gordonia crocea]GED96299.1 hypothetical protein nbrc107697_03380 [Gordonia crocea]
MTAASIVHTRITHSRRAPVVHGFGYRGVSWLVDIDDLPRLPRGLGWLARFRADDHFPQPRTPAMTLRSRLEEYLDSVDVPRPTGRVTALTSPRVVGYVFNPITVFWCHDRAGTLSYVVAEVHNTYGHRFCYVVQTDADGQTTVDKQFYVSPFNDVTGRYRLTLPDPLAANSHGRVRLAVCLDRDGQPPFVATLTGRATPATTAEILRAQLRAPLAPWLVAARIRLHGIWLWSRGLRIQPRPASPQPPIKGLHP